MPQTPDHEDATVTYTVRDLLSEIKHEQAVGFTELKTAMSEKASKADLVSLEHRLDRHAEKLETHGRVLSDLQTWRHGAEQTSSALAEHRSRTSTAKRWAIGTGVSLLMLTASLVGPHL